MFGMQLTVLQKLEIAFICVILGIAGVLVFRNTRPTFDQTVMTYKLDTRPHPKIERDANGRYLPITATNPRDPVKDEVVTVFACSDGRFLITEYPNDAKRRPKLAWEPEVRQAIVYHYYQDPMAPVDAIKDQFRRALAYANYSLVYKNKRLGLLENVGLTQQQKDQAGKGMNDMLAEIALIDKQMADGTKYGNLMDAVMKAFNTYNGLPGDPTKDAKKGELARNVLLAAAEYDKQIYADKDKAIDKYIDALVKNLNQDQQEKLVEQYRITTQPAPTGGTRPPAASRRTAAPGAGGAGGGAGAAGGTGGTRGTTRGGARGAATPATQGAGG